MSAVSHSPGETEIWTYNSKKGGKWIVTNQRVIWLGHNGAVTQLLVPHITKVTWENKGVVRKEYNLYIGRPNGTWETTSFDNESDCDAMRSAVQQAMLTG